MVTHYSPCVLKRNFLVYVEYGLPQYPTVQDCKEIETC